MTLPLQLSRKEKHDLVQSLLIENEEQSKLLWKDHYGSLRGFRQSWDSKFKRDVPLQAELDDIPVTDLKPNASMLRKVKGGWAVSLYYIVGSKAKLLSTTEPERKHFAMAKLQTMLTRGDLDG